MYNEIFGIASFIVTFALMVLMYRCFGKQGLIAWVAIGTIIANIQVIKAVHILVLRLHLEMLCLLLYI